MSDVFISYARSTAPEAEQVAAALRGLGYGVWRDDDLPAHRAYSEVIEERLKAAKAVVVLWSAEAAKSQWVRAEADAARSVGTLVQGSIDGTVPPMPFNQIQCADLKEWAGNGDAAGWRKLAASVEALVGAPADDKRRPARRGRASICVLPFQNMSGDAEQEYFSDGISEDITTDLSKVSALAVTARNTAFTLKGQSVNVRDVALKLGVSYILEGSVRKANKRVRITAQLIDGATGDHVWAERYDRDLTDIFTIQDEITGEIVSALKLKLLPAEKKAIEQRGTNSVEAYNLYLMAREFWISGNHGDPRREEAVERICKQAVELDPNYARAWALMALAQSNLRSAFSKEGDGGVAAAETALSIDPDIAEAHSATAQNLAFEGKAGEANAELDLALAIDPDSWEANKMAGRIAMIQRRVPQATGYFEKAAALMDSDFHSWGMLLTCYRAQGNEQKIRYAAKMLVERAEKALSHDPTNGQALGMVASGLALLGDRARAREWIERALVIDPDNLNMRYNFACVLANEFRDNDAALDLLETVYSRCAAAMVTIAETDPDMDVLRDDPRFEKMLEVARRRCASAEKSQAPAA